VVFWIFSSVQVTDQAENHFRDRDRFSGKPPGFLDIDQFRVYRNKILSPCLTARGLCDPQKMDSFARRVPAIALSDIRCD